MSFWVFKSNHFQTVQVWDSVYGMKRLIIINKNILCGSICGGMSARACSPTYALYISIFDRII